MDRLLADHEQIAADGIFLSSCGLDDKRNCVELSIDPVTPALVRDFQSRYGEALEFQFSPRPMAVPSAWPTEPEVVAAVEAAAPDQQMVTAAGTHSRLRFWLSPTSRMSRRSSG